MSFDLALRATELLLAWALFQQSAEHLVGPRRDLWIYVPRLVLALVLASGLAPGPTLTALWGLQVALLLRYDGAYNGGSDKMTILVLTCTGLATWLTGPMAEVALGYLALQLMLSYFVSGWVKLTNPAWRNGAVLHDVFEMSAYPVSNSVRRIAQRPGAVWAGCCAVIGFEVLFPLALLHPLALQAALGTAALFHLANACLFGLNRFLWTWIAAFPSLLWLQTRLPFGAGGL